MLRSLEREFHLAIQVVDISQKPELRHRFGHDIPVALLGGRLLFKHRAVPARLRKAFQDFRDPG